MDKDDVISTMRDYLKNSIQYMPSLIKKYKDNNNSNIAKDMMDLCEGLIWIEQVSKSIFKDYNISFLENYKDIFEALENDDYNLICDIIYYDILPKMKDIENTLSANFN